VPFDEFDEEFVFGVGSVEFGLLGKRDDMYFELVWKPMEGVESGRL
jgi:hypothetical protein